MKKSDIQKIVESSIHESLQEKEKFNELAGLLIKSLKTAGFTIAAYYIFKQLLQQILTDKKFLKNFSQQIADRLDYLNRKQADRILNPLVPNVLKGYGTVTQPVYTGKGGRVVKGGGQNIIYK